MKEASQKESEAMLTGMSLEEIKDQQQEIEQALSPDLIAFLKNRRRKQNHNNSSTTGGKQEQPTTAPKKEDCDGEVASMDSTVDNEKTKRQEKLAEREEKERIAKLVASIQTHEDLDSTYRAEMKGDVFGLDIGDNDDNNKEKEQFLVACDLLRSSSPRQTLWAARTVSIKLEGLIATKSFIQQKQRFQRNDRKEEEKMDSAVASTVVEAGNNQSIITTDELPSVLPVSMRCLLDKPLNSSCNYLLHTYALQSLYYLTILYAHPGHDVIYHNLSSLMSCSTGVSVFQEDFMDDAVPSPSLDTAYPPMSVRPLDVDEKTGVAKISSQTTASAAAYMTSSSTASAVTDGVDFQKDPMWTLLSKMKILPRLAFLLEHQQHMKDIIPAEALIAICGIVSMVGQRSPGAASAIVQHKSLISLLLNRMLERVQQGWSSEKTRHQQETNSINVSDSDGDEHKGNGIVLATMRLFCIVSRQSRVAAEGLPLEDILPPLMAAGLASSYPQFRIQQHALFLWRTVLRYGLGLEALASMLTESARHFALPYFHKFSLSSEFLSSFTLVLECVKVVRSKTANNTLTAKIGDKTSEPTTRITSATIDIAETATKILASTLPMVFPKTLTIAPINDPNDNKNWISTCRWNASRLLYLSAWFQLFDPTINPAVTGDVSVEDYISLDDQESLLLMLQAWVEPSGDVQRAWHSVAKWCDPSLGFEKASSDTDTSIRSEAAASGFLNAYFSIALVLLRSTVPNRRLKDIKRTLHEKIVGMIFEGLNFVMDTSVAIGTSNDVSSSSMSSAREGWINQCYFAVAKFCFHSMSMGLAGSSSDLTLTRSLVFSLLGRLQKGNEAVAAVVFSSDILFQTCGDPALDDDVASTKLSTSSPISSMFLGEICGSESARKQLDHSFKLQHGFGITSAGFGPFASDSLLSCADKPNTAPSAAKDGPDDQTLPLGKLWLWQCLSGSIKMREDVVAVGTKEAADVIASVLELILELDETEEVMDIVGYTGRLPIGSKLYYLMNVCLHHEHVLRDERILNTGEVVLDRYLQNFGCNENDITDFCQECLDHSGHTGKMERSDDGEEAHDALEEKDKKLLDDFANALTINLADSKLSSEQIRALVAFLEDLATAYRDYGAQYDFFTKCIRVFLLPMFPSLIRCRGLKELQNMLHLLTLSRETEDENEMMQLLLNSLTGGLPAADNSLRDGTDVLNAVAKAIAAASTRPLEGYTRHFCIGMLARNFAISLSTKQGIEISRKRLERLKTKNVMGVCKATELFLRSGDGTKNSLVKAIIDSSSFDYSKEEQNTSDEKQFVARFLDSFISNNA